MKRHKMSRKASKKDFSSKASRVHVKNLQRVVGPMRGGIRL